MCVVAPFKGTLFIVFMCLLVALLTYLSMTLFPKIRKSKEPVYYRAAILEVVPFMESSMSIHEVVQRNLKTYELAVNLSSSNGVDIIVFPESVLYINVDDFKYNRTPLIGSIAENVPDPKLEEYIPCDQERKFRNNHLLRNLSCIAKEGGMFVVANIIDYKRCKDVCGVTDEDASSNCSDDDECPEDGMYFYNTNVVFNRVGKLIARYHKKHLYFEPTMNPSKCSDDGYFETDFGTFVTFICFDMVFKEAEDIIERTQVDNIAYPYYWFDHTPLMFFATIFQQSFAVFNKINILAADGHVPGTGTLGSGIFSGSNGALIYTRKPDGRTKLLISNVPKYPKENNVIDLGNLNRKKFLLENDTWIEDQIEEDVVFDNECNYTGIEPPEDSLNDYQCFSTNMTEFEFVKLQHSEGTVDACSRGFCCSVSYKVNSMDEDYFLSISTDGFDSNKTFIFAVQSCFLTRCKSVDGENCTSFALQSDTMFEKAELKGNFTTKYVYPFSVDSNLRLTKREEWNFDGKSQISYKSSNGNSSLLFLGIFGRNFL